MTTKSTATCDSGRCAPTAGSERAVRIFHALGSGARICMVRELDRCGELSVSDLVGCCGLGWSTVSHHLSILREAGIVTDERRGKQIFYRLALRCVTEFLSCLDDPDCPGMEKQRAA